LRAAEARLRSRPMAVRTPPPGSVVTLIEGGSFCVSGPAGDISASEAGAGHGLYVADRRLLSRLVMTVNGQRLEPVDHHRDDPAAATFVGRLPQGAGAGIGPVIVRRRTLGTGLRDHVEVRNLGDEPGYAEIEIDLGADLAPVAAVRDGRPLDGPVEPAATTTGEVLLVRGKGTTRAGCRVTGTEGVVAEGGTLRWEAIVPARASRSLTVVVAPIVAGAELVPGPLLAPGAPRTESARQLARWYHGVPRITTDHPPLLAAVRRSAHDLGSLRVLDPEVPGRAVVAAAAPWHLALHGRGALLTAWMSLIVDPGLALGTVETLARLQGDDVDERTEEHPGASSTGCGSAPPGSGRTRAAGSGPSATGRSLLRLDPHVPQGRLWLSPVLPRAISTLRVERVPLLGGTVTVSVDGDRVEVDDLPGDIEVVAEPRPPLAVM
jgi:hypothetical protein